MAEPAIDGGAVDVVVPMAAYANPSEGGGAPGGGGGGNGDAEEDSLLMANGAPPTREEIDAKLEAVEARLESRLSYIVVKLDSMKVPSLWQITGIVFGAVVALVGIIGIMADRFDGGLAARGVLEPLIKPVIESQKARDAKQDEQLNKILKAVEQIRDKPQGSPAQGQN